LYDAPNLSLKAQWMRYVAFMCQPWVSLDHSIMA
jgi:hypothetical protein